MVAAAIALVLSLSRFELPREANTITWDDLKFSYNTATQWFLTQFDHDTNEFIYQYDNLGVRTEGVNNPVRQLMASRLLADLAAEQPELIPQHSLNLATVFRRWYKERDGQGYIEFDGSSKLGASAMALRTLVASPLFPQFADEAAALSRGILGLRDSANLLQPWFLEPDYRFDPDYLMTFYSGEALLALAEYAELVGDAYLLSQATAIQHAYVTHYVDELSERYYPAYVPWHTMSLRKLYALTKDARFLEGALILNDKLLELQDTTDQVGRFYNPETPQYGAPHASSDGVYTEGLVYAYALAEAEGQVERCRRYARALTFAFGHLVALQSRQGVHEQDHLAGSIPTIAGKAGTRIDNTQHALDAFRALFDVAQETGVCKDGPCGNAFQLDCTVQDKG